MRNGRFPHHSSLFFGCDKVNGGNYWQEGLAILQHPSSHGFPSPWFTRDYGFLSPTPMYWPEDGKATRIAKGKKLMLAYRVLVFSGTPESAGIAEAYETFSKQNPE